MSYNIRFIYPILIPIMVVFFYGCATKTLESKTFKSYEIGSTKTSYIGEPFLIDQEGTVETKKEWVGIARSPDGWKITEEYSQDFIRKELIYAGKSGNTIEVNYREYRGGMAAPAFFQNIKYDITDTNVIRFQNFVIEVFEADTQKIKYVILSD